jgi:hypothetical protein
MDTSRTASRLDDKAAILGATVARRGWKVSAVNAAHGQVVDLLKA